ncbi:MAG: hypothetical protein J6D03_10620 [Clostridia bacterium]|nr:hypothetical protein [Clostridia bacterium]
MTAKGKAPSYAISWQISITAWLDYCGYNSNWSVNVSFDCDQHSDWTGSCLYDAIPNPGGTFDNNGSFGSTTDKTLSFSGTAYITVYTGELVTPSSISAGNTTINGEAVTTGGQTCYRYNGSISGTQSWSSSFNETSGYGIYINVTI